MFFRLFLINIVDICCLFVEQSNETKSTNQTSTMSICEISTSLSGVIRFNDIFVEKEVGEGSYGKVYVGKWNGAHVALKFCKNKGQIEEFINEMKLMMYDVCDVTPQIID